MFHPDIHLFIRDSVQELWLYITLTSCVSLNLPSSSTTSRELLSQCSTLVDEDDLMWFKKIKEIYHVLVSQFHEKFRSKSPGCREIKSVFMDVIVCAMPFVAGPKLKRYQVNVLCLHSCTQTN